MDKEIIQLLRSLAGNAETLVIWYMVLDVLKVVLHWAGGILVGYLLLRIISKLEP